MNFFVVVKDTQMPVNDLLIILLYILAIDGSYMMDNREAKIIVTFSCVHKLSDFGP